MDAYLGKPLDADQVIETLARRITPFVDEDAVPLDSEWHSVDEGSALPRLPGFDMEAALKRLRGNRRLLFSLLRDFAETQKGAVAAIRTALEEGDQEQSRHLVHALRGNAGNLSAGPLVMAARALEEAWRNGGAPDVENLLEQVELTLHQALEAVSSLFKEMVASEEHVIDSVGKRPVDLDALTPRLSRLYGFLTKNSVLARKHLSSVTDLLQGTPLENESRRIEESLVKFDFGGARAVVENLAIRYCEERKDMRCREKRRKY